MKIILLMIVLVGNGLMPVVVEFNTQQACVLAQQKLILKLGSDKVVYASCNPKGLVQEEIENE